MAAVSLGSSLPKKSIMIFLSPLGVDIVNRIAAAVGVEIAFEAERVELYYRPPK